MHQFHHTNLIFPPSRPFYMQLSTTNICPLLFLLHLTFTLSIANILCPLPPLSPPSSLLHPPSPPHTFVFLSCHPSLILLTCTHPMTHIYPPPSSLLPLLHPSHMHACTHTHTPSTTYELSPHKSGWVMAKFMHSDWSVRVARSCMCHAVSPGFEYHIDSPTGVPHCEDQGGL